MSDSKHSENDTKKVRDIIKGHSNSSISSKLGNLQTKEKLSDDSGEEEDSAEKNDGTD